MKVIIHQETIEFIRYPYSPSSVCGQRIVSAFEIKNVNFNFLPLAIFSRGEFIFIPLEYRQDLELFAHRNQIPHSKSVDIWSLVLEPFEDSANFEKKHNARSLLVYGLNTEMVKRLRRKYRRWQGMNIFRGGIWSGWRPDLGIFDAIDEASVLEIIPIWGPKLFRKTYWEIMDVAKKAEPDADTPE